MRKNNKFPFYYTVKKNFVQSEFLRFWLCKEVFFVLKIIIVQRIILCSSDYNCIRCTIRILKISQWVKVKTFLLIYIEIKRNDLFVFNLKIKRSIFYIKKVFFFIIKNKEYSGCLVRNSSLSLTSEVIQFS